MCNHEEKRCPRCNSAFQCKVGSINLCQCTTVELNEMERDYVSKKYDDCLCASCLLIMQKEYKQKRFEAKINRAFEFFNLKSPFKNE